jgi:REP-associated tyrosine transposase
MTFYRRKLPHLQRDAKPHFITFVTYQRSILAEWARDVMLQCCLHDHKRRYDLHVAVVMPDHVHMILTPLIDTDRKAVHSLPAILSAIKGSAAHAINKKMNVRRPVWQEESFDHVLRSSESLNQKIVYVLENPQRGGLVTSWQDYPWLWHQPFPNPYSPDSVPR